MAGLAIVMMILFLISMAGNIYLGVRLSRALKAIEAGRGQLEEKQKEYDKYKAECFCHDIT